MTEEPTPPSTVFAERVRELRKSRPWRQEDLAKRLLELEGLPVNAKNVNNYRVKVARTEKGERGASVDDVFLFAAALGVSPLSLLLPAAPLTSRDPNNVVQVGRLRLNQPLLAAWVHGRAPLRRDDIDVYLHHQPRLPYRFTDASELLRATEKRPEVNDETREALLAVAAILRHGVVVNLTDLQSNLDELRGLGAAASSQEPLQDRIEEYEGELAQLDAFEAEVEQLPGAARPKRRKS